MQNSWSLRWYHINLLLSLTLLEGTRIALKQCYCNPTMNLKDERPRYAYALVPWYSYGLIFLYIPKKNKHLMNDIKITSEFPILHKCRFTVKYKPKLRLFAKKVINARISPFFCFCFCLFCFCFCFVLFWGILKEDYDVSNIYRKIQDGTKMIFIKIVIYNITRFHPPLTLSLWRLTQPVSKVVPQLVLSKWPQRM